MGFTTNESSVRVDIFKSSGKWYETIAIDMEGFYDEPIVSDAVAKALEKQTKYIKAQQPYLDAMYIVCLEPYHENSFPISFKVETKVS